MNIVSRAEARAAGARRYFTGKPCRNGHVAERLSSNGTCLECERTRESKIVWTVNNPERKRRSSAKYYKKNSEKILTYGSAYHVLHPDKAAARRRRMQETNPGRIAETVAAWRQNNKHKMRAQCAKRRARLIMAMPLWLTAEHFSQIEEVYSDAKRLEAETGAPHHVDHIVPLRGKTVCGLHVPWNLRAIPADDNLRKANKLDDAA